jgi:hypothetical protein
MKKWKFLFGFSAFLFALDLVKFPFRASIDFPDFIALIFGGFSLFPLYGYAYQITIGSKPIAIVIFGLNALIGLAGFLTLSALIFNSPNIGAIIGAAVAILLLCIFLYPQFMYAFKCDALWKENA